MAKKKAPVTLTGGEGFNFEAMVAARFLVDMLGGIYLFGEQLGTIVRLDWQARDSGRLLDDLVLTLNARDGVHVAEFSIKRDRQVTAGGFPDSFVIAAWEQWLGKHSNKFRTTEDLLVLLVGDVADGVMNSWHTLLSESRATTAERMVSRLAGPVQNVAENKHDNVITDTVAGDVDEEGSQTSTRERTLFKSLHCPESIDKSLSADTSATVELIRQLRLLHYDFRNIPSRDEANAIADCRSLLKSGDKEEAINLWDTLISISATNRGSGGSLDLPGLLNALRGRFELKDHPDYRADWETLNRYTQESLADIRTEVAGLGSLERRGDLEKLQTNVKQNRVCLTVGESGCGKSAVAKLLAEQDYNSITLLPGDLFNSGRLLELERLLGLSHPLHDVLRVNRGERCLLMFDSIERFSSVGSRLLGRIIAAVLADEGCRHINIVLTCQFESLQRVLSHLEAGGLKNSDHAVLPIDCPKEADIQQLLLSSPISWLAFHKDMRPLLRNLKILDWVVRATERDGSFPTGTVTGLPSLIDYLWMQWVEQGGEDLARSALLKHLAIEEGETLSFGIPLTNLAHSEHQSIAGLRQDELLRVRHERVYFTHDLLGDWARLRILIGDDLIASASRRTQAVTPRWHRAVRLYGRWLLSQSNGVERWRQAVECVDDGTDEGNVLRDLLLEAVVLSENSGALLEQAWPALVANSGRLLNRLLDRFMFVGTIPDERLKDLVGEEDVELIEFAFRVPFWPYWPGVISVLHRHSDDAVRLAAPITAEVCRMWLGKMPVELSPGLRLPWRDESADLVLRLAREMQAKRVKERYGEMKGEQVAYEAMLYAAADRADEVAELALELAQRRPAIPASEQPEHEEESDDASDTLSMLE